MASNGNSVDPVEVKEEPESLVRKCRANSQEIFNLETNYRELQRTARELGIPSNLKKTMLKELIKAYSEGDHDEVRCILAEAKDIKERKKRERLQKKEEPFQIIKQEDVEFPNVTPPMDQSNQMSLTARLAYLQRYVKATSVPNVRIQRISQTEMRTEYLQPAANRMRRQCFVQNSSKQFSSSSTYAPHQQELLANSSSYLMDKTKFSPKLMNSSKRYLDLPRTLPYSKSSVSYSSNPKIKSQPCSVKSTGSSSLKHHSSIVQYPCTPRAMTSLDNMVKTLNQQKLHGSMSDFSQNSASMNVSDRQIKHSSQTTSSYPIGSNNSKNILNYTTDYTLLNNSESPMNYPVQSDCTIRSKNHYKNILEPISPDNSNNQNIYEPQPLPVNSSNFSDRSLNYNPTTLDWPASTITSSDQSEFDHVGQTGRKSSDPDSFHDSKLCEENPNAWKLPTSDSVRTEPIENLHGHQMAPQIIPGYYNSEYPTSYNYQWNASITFPNQSVSYRPVAFCQSRQQIFSLEQYHEQPSSSVPILRDLLTAGKIWSSAQDHNYTGKTKNMLKCEVLTVEETISKNPLWEQSSEVVTECEMNKQKHISASENLEIKSESSDQFCEEIVKVEENPSTGRTNKRFPTVESTIDVYSSDSNEPLPKVGKTTRKPVYKQITTPISHAERIRTNQVYDSRNESFQDQFHESNHGPLPPVELLLQNRFRKSQDDRPPPESENAMTSQICEPSTVAQPEFGSCASDLDCLASTAMSMCQQLDDYSYDREKPNEISRTPNIPIHQNNVVATRAEPSSKDIPTWNSFLQQATASPVFCQFGCKTVIFKGDDQVRHEMNCPLRVVSCPSELCNWTNCIQSLTSHIYEVHQVVAKPETYFVVQFINHRLQGIPNHELLGVKRFSFYQTTQQRLFVIKVAVDQATLNVHAYAQFINDQVGSHSLAVLEVCCPDGYPVRWVGPVYPFSLNPVHIVSSENCLKFNMGADDGWGSNFSLHVKLRTFQDTVICEQFIS